jgi:predicted amidohydrolase
MTAYSNDQAANLAKGTDFCRQASAQGADIALFPEMWNIGYSSFVAPTGPSEDLWKAPQLWEQSISTPKLEPSLVSNSASDRSATPLQTSNAFDEAQRQWQAQAIGLDEPFVSHFKALAQELNMAIALTFLEKWQGAPRNSVALIDRYGEVKFVYAKVHTCDFSWPEAALTAGQDFYVSELDTAHGQVKVGAMICFDREFPESARLLMLKGAELILTPNACTLEANRIGQFRARAFENQVGVALANYAAPQENGHSVAFSPIAFDEHGSCETQLVEASQSEGIFIADFDMVKIREYRQREVWGNAFRKVASYSQLTQTCAAPPFLRVNRDGKPYQKPCCD